MLYLALDQSTSATKALLFDGAGQVIDRAARDHTQHYPQPGWVEHDAEEIWANTVTLLDTLAQRHSARWADVVALSITNQRETIVVFDRATGAPLHRALVWQCRRGEAICRRHLDAGDEALVRSRSGLKIDPYFSASKLQWLMEEHPEIAARLDDGSALIGTIDTYLIYRLTGGAVFATDGTNACRTLLFDIGQQRWDAELCRCWNVPERALPEVRESSAAFGETTLDGRWARPLPIRGVMGDSQAALLAQGCVEAGEAKVTFGTGSSLLLNIGARPQFSTQGVLTTLAWTINGESAYAYEGVIISSASTLNWLRDQLGLAASINELEQWAMGLPDNGGVYLVPAFTGLGLPYWAPDARAAITGLSSHSDKRHLARAAYESISYQVAEALDAMRDEADVELTAIAADGGPTVSAFLMQFTADMTQVELRVAAVAECSALGAVQAGRLGLGHLTALADLSGASKSGAVYRPERSETEGADMLAGWRQAVQQTLSFKSIPTQSPDPLLAP
ncbi:FGGY family carbohydrate kinase [Actomonas aquatica]|uniref:ATP:glycerol 3-phosphotransferase n=1 Tax=Actomonas aquatica TaxID=2866162 RepID=A0ABZ1C9T2_9BACT|nr:glycerol kinase GlpK [Opitutus sp. WL0086]WRQ88231.1 glycerol kinase GlpK [Opitutus sp. WL0086]